MGSKSDVRRVKSRTRGEMRVYVGAHLSALQFINGRFICTPESCRCHTRSASLSAFLLLPLPVDGGGASLVSFICRTAEWSRPNSKTSFNSSPRIFHFLRRSVCPSMRFASPFRLAPLFTSFLAFLASRAPPSRPTNRTTSGH